MAHKQQPHDLSQRNKDTGFIEQYAPKDSSSQSDRDTGELKRIGKLPVLKRSYGFLAITGFTCTVLITWEGVLVTMNIGLENGGLAGMLYMFLFAWVGAWCTFASLCELCSMAPTSAGQYFWVAMLAPESKQRFLSYVTGWMTVIGWQALDASTAFIAGTLIQALIVLTIPGYSPQNWHGTLLTWAVLLWGFCINTITRQLLPRLEGLILVIHILGFFGVLLPLVVTGSHRESADVWASFKNLGGWPTQGVSTMVGLLMSIFLFTGVDGAIHMSEEIHHASIVVPRAIMASMALNGALGFAMLVAFAYAVRDVDASLDSPVGQQGYAFLDILQSSVGSVASAAGLGCINALMQVWSNTADMAAASRMLWAFARDRAVPGWGFFVQLDTRTLLPVRCVVVSVVVPGLLALINIGSSTAFNDVIGLVTAGYYSSYLMANSFLLYRRCTGAILAPEEYNTPKEQGDNPNELVNNVGKRLVWGPWRIPGLLGIVVNAVSCVYLVIALFWSFWPSGLPVTAENMNYNCLVFGGVMVIAVVYYIVRGHKEYSGPVIEVAE